MNRSNVHIKNRKRNNLYTSIHYILLLSIFLVYCSDDPGLVSHFSACVETVVLEPVFPRAGKSSLLSFSVRNTGDGMSAGTVQLVLPDEIAYEGPGNPEKDFAGWPPFSTKRFDFPLNATNDEIQEVRVRILSSETVMDTLLELQWHSQVHVDPSLFAPSPETAETGRYLLGAMRCDLWRADGVWDVYREGYLDRQPVIGWYQEGEPEVTDWEIKYALDHGIRFFVHCWYRDPLNMGKSPIQPRYDHVLNSYENSKYGDQMGYAINWINSQTEASGVADEADFLENLLPFWIDEYFKDPNYLKIGNKPVLWIYNPDRFIQDLGSESNATDVINTMRAIVQQAGFDGIVVIGCYQWGPSDKVNGHFKTIGLQYTSSYHWPSFGQVLSNMVNPSGEDIIQGHKTCWQNQETHGALPNIITCSMGWDSDPWGGMTSSIKWRLTPEEYQSVLQNAKAMMDSRQTENLESRMVLLDNWNEYGEGHYIFPTRQYAFGYLDAVRNVFSTENTEHVDLIPDDLGAILPVH